MTTNLAISKDSADQSGKKVKQSYRETVRGLMLIIPVILVFTIILEKFLPARNYGADPTMEEFCSSVKIVSSDQGTLPIEKITNTYKCASYYGMKMLLKTLYP